MKFRKLVIENYKSFRFPTEIHFPDGTDGKSIFLIGGMNGAGKTSIMEAVNYCLYGARPDEIFKNINRKERASGNTSVSFEMVVELDDLSELVVKRAWNAGATDDAKAKDLDERLVIVQDGKRISVQNKQMWQDFISTAIPPGITQFFFFDGEKIQEIAADDHSEVRLKSSLEAALGIQYITRLSKDILVIKQEDRKGFVEISNEDLDFKESELNREKSNLSRRHKELKEGQNELEQFKAQHKEAKKRFQATFHAEPETRDSLRQIEKRRIQASKRLGQVENETKSLCENYLPFSIAGKLFADIRSQIVVEREKAQIEAVHENAAVLAKRIVRAVEEPNPIYHEKLPPEKMEELEQRIFRLLKEGNSVADVTKVLNLSDRDAARVLHQIETLENSDVFLIQPLLEEKQELMVQIRQLEPALQPGMASDTEKELFEQLHTEMESCSTQIGRKTEQVRLLEDDIMGLEKRIRAFELDLEKLYEKHNVSREKADFINECDAVASLLNQFAVRLRQNKVYLLQEKTFEMYRMLSSRSGLIKDITIDDKSYEIRISDRNGHEIKKSGLSAGEKEVFAISLLWGLVVITEN